jgi:phosphoribosylanthranilate isomerase
LKIKICGVRTYDQAMAIIEAGADIIGFNFYPKSPRYISPGEALKVAVRLQTTLREEMARVTLVGVFVNANPEYVHTLTGDCLLDRIQLSGDEPPGDLEILGERAYKVLRPPDEQTLADAVCMYPKRVLAPAWMIDTYHPGQYGGTGKPADWEMIRRFAEREPIILAGGLRVENVAEAIRLVRPWGVDVASGVESAPGVKDLEKVKAFVRAVQECSEEIQA